MTKTYTTGDRRGGFYFGEGNKPYLSTTEILKIINKPALSYWFGREVYRYVLLNPTADEKTALGAPYQMSATSKTRGTTVHSIVEAFKNTGEAIDTIPEEFKGYATAFYQFMKDHKMEFIDQEKTIFDDVNMVAGTLDVYGKLGENFHVLDVKTGKDIYPEVSLQLSSYANMMRQAGHTVNEISVLLLETGENGKPTGKYKFQTLTENFKAFLACKKLYEWNNEEKLIKLGYLKA